MHRMNDGSAGKEIHLTKGLKATPALTKPDERIHSVDLARGVAVSLMILSHGVNGLMPFDDFPEWGRYIHLFTKFSSSLFIVVFGVSLAIAHLPYVGSADWPRRRKKMILTGLVILFWYKVLTVVEMLQFHEPAEIVDTLLYRSFPSFVEILGFYAIALLWAPFLLVVWSKTPLLLRLASPLLPMILWWSLNEYFHFRGSEQIEAILIEHEDHYTWGQVARGNLILLGLLIGEGTVAAANGGMYRRRLIGMLAGGSIAMFAVLFPLIASDITGELVDIARNVGKHPPGLRFMLFSLGGALLILSLCLAGGNRLASLLQPLTVIGTNALQAFIFHIVVIFVIFRFLLGYWQNVSYNHALVLALLLIPATAVWIWLVGWMRRNR
jgi:fucose 4-O-acetylase-like acetyltransferase